jgi:uncharacterized protein YhfF
MRGMTLPPPFELGRAGTELRTQLVHAVLRGEKTATAGLPDDAMPPPSPGTRFTLHDVDDEPVGVVEVTGARVVPAGEIDIEFARDEGEGFETVDDWRRAHEAFFARELPDDTPIEAVRFRLSHLIVASRYRGPARSGNGGYTCGLVAGLRGGTDVEVTLRVPPPLDRPLRIDGDAVYDGDTLVADARPAVVELELPRPVPAFEQAPVAPADHPFPTCFTCGPARTDGLGLLPAPVGDGRVAATWRVRQPTVERVWAALDCPGAFAVNPDFERGITVLGRLAAHVEEVPRDGEEVRVVAWPLPGGDERRSYAGTCVLRGETPLAWARATWFAVGDEFRDPLPSRG